MTFGDASAFSSFNPTPRAPSAPEVHGPYAFDDDAKTVDLALLGTWDEGHTAASTIFRMMKGDASMPEGPFDAISVREPYASEGLEEGQTVEDLPLYTVVGFDAVCPFDYPILLKDEHGTFATIPMKGSSYADLRLLVHKAVSSRMGGSGAWRSQRAFIDGDGMNVPIVRA